MGRFAPTPSGRMHLGNVFSLLNAWLLAKSDGGKILLRIEDLYGTLCPPKYENLIKSDLEWLGLYWDYEVQPQRERGNVYQEVIDSLISAGLVYPCWCTHSVLNVSKAPHATDGHIVYPGNCRNLTVAERQGRRGTPSFRLQVPNKVYGCVDGVQGAYYENLAKDCGDFVLKKADGSFSYQLAVTVDDYLEGVNQVVRGADLLTSVPRQLYLTELLGGTAPSYYHVPLLNGVGGRKLSKRDLDLDLGELRMRTDSAKILGYLAYLSGIIPQNIPKSAEDLLKVFDKSNILQVSKELDAEVLLKG